MSFSIFIKSVKLLLSFKLICIALLVVLVPTAIDARKNGYLSQKIEEFHSILDEYHHTLKCVADIAEDLMPGNFYLPGFN